MTNKFSPFTAPKESLPYSQEVGHCIHFSAGWTLATPSFFNTLINQFQHYVLVCKDTVCIYDLFHAWYMVRSYIFLYLNTLIIFGKLCNLWFSSWCTFFQHSYYFLLASNVLPTHSSNIFHLLIIRSVCIYQGRIFSHWFI
jgi:hypothetical protein